MIEFINVEKTYEQGNKALNGVNMQIEDGEFCFLVGASGSGKSTLLYAVSGMDAITAGDVLFDGQSLGALSQNALADLRLDEMGFIFQQMYMLKNLTVLDNIVLPACQSKKLGETRKETVLRAQALMRKLGIIESADKDITEVSGGELQRACICRSLINKPKVIFADEPTGALNRASSDEVMDEIAKINSEGTTILLVTHDAKVAAKCSKVLYLVDGNIKGEYNLGSYTSPADLRQRERTLNNWLMEMGW